MIAIPYRPRRTGGGAKGSDGLLLVTIPVAIPLDSEPLETPLNGPAVAMPLETPLNGPAVAIAATLSGGGPTARRWALSAA
jgi:hypothetical protein